MNVVKLTLLTMLAMVAFACNSLFSRVALVSTSIDAATFTLVRIVAGALTLYLLVMLRQGGRSVGGSWLSSLALIAYAAGFSFAYRELTAATGALLLFGAVQCTMIGYALWQGERMSQRQVIAVLVAVAGLIGLLLPGLSAPPLLGTVLMLGAGLAWGVYSLRGRGAGDATRETCGNFVRAVPAAVLISVLSLQHFDLDALGVLYAVASGALASGLGYAIWYSVLPQLAATTAAIVQLTVPAITAIGGVLFLGEGVSLRFLLASVAILGGVAVYILEKRKKAA